MMKDIITRALCMHGIFIVLLLLTMINDQTYFERNFIAQHII